MRRAAEDQVDDLWGDGCSPEVDLLHLDAAGFDRLVGMKRAAHLLAPGLIEDCYGGWWMPAVFRGKLQYNQHRFTEELIIIRETDLDQFASNLRTLRNWRATIVGVVGDEDLTWYAPNGTPLLDNPVAAFLFSALHDTVAPYANQLVKVGTAIWEALHDVGAPVSDLDTYPIRGIGPLFIAYELGEADAIELPARSWTDPVRARRYFDPALAGEALTTYESLRHTGIEQGRAREVAQLLTA